MTIIWNKFKKILVQWSKGGCSLEIYSNLLPPKLYAEAKEWFLKDMYECKFRIDINRNRSTKSSDDDCKEKNDASAMSACRKSYVRQRKKSDNNDSKNHITGTHPRGSWSVPAPVLFPLVSFHCMRSWMVCILSSIAWFSCRVNLISMQKFWRWN